MESHPDRKVGQGGITPRKEGGTGWNHTLKGRRDGVESHPERKETGTDHTLKGRMDKKLGSHPERKGGQGAGITP